MNETIKKEIIDISIEDIVPNRFQPRLTFDTEALNELANSIKEHGIIQPLVVRRLQDKFEIIAGERRYKAASLIGMKKVPCIVMDLNDNESAEVAVIENIQRKEMTPLEEAKSFKKILDRGYLTQDELAKKMGKSQSSIANKLRLLNLDEIVQDAILEGKISERHARSLLKIDDKIEQRNVLAEIINKRLTVRQTDELINEKIGKNVDNMNNSGINNDIFNNINQNHNQQDYTNISNIFKEPTPEISQSQQNLPQNLSIPVANIPNNVSTNINPQTDLINNINVSKENYNQFNQNIPSNEQKIIPSSSLDIFKINDSTVTETNKQDIQSIINPSVFSSNEINSLESLNNKINEEPINSVINDGMNVDISEIKNNAQDIIQKTEPEISVEKLLTSNNKPENKFFIDLDFKEEINSSDNLPEKLKNAVNQIEKKVDEIKLQGINITKEETDLGNTYQIIIRIDK